MTPRITTNRNILFLIASCFPVFFACSKNSSPDNPPATTDTLATGWKKITMPNLTYNDIFFINDNTGYLVGDGNIFRSTDGGNNWQKVYWTPSGLINIAMGNESNIVFISAINNRIIFTKNGGASFDSISIGGSVSDAFFVNATTVYAVDGTSFWKSINAGSTWSKISNLPSLISGEMSLHFLSDQYGWIAGIGGPYKTVNGGVTWEQKPSPDFTFTYGSVFFVDADNGYASDGRRICKTSNGGSTWNKVFTGVAGYQDLYFISTDQGFITEGSYIYKTLNGGNTWSKEVVLPHKDIIELHFTDPSHGWACGTWVVLKYQN